MIAKKNKITPGSSRTQFVYPPNKPHYCVSGLLMDYPLEKLFIARGFGYKRAPWKASKPQSRHETLKPQSRKAAMERASRKAAKLPWNAQAAKPQSCKAARPPSRKLCDSCAASCVHRRCVATAMDRWSRKAAKPQSCHGTRKPQSRKAASSETQAPSPVFIAAVLPEHQEASKGRKPPRRRSTTKRQSGKASRSAKASRSVIAKLQEAAQRRSVKEPPTKGWLCLEGDGLAY